MKPHVRVERAPAPVLGVTFQSDSRVMYARTTDEPRLCAHVTVSEIASFGTKVIGVQMTSAQLAEWCRGVLEMLGAPYTDPQ